MISCLCVFNFSVFSVCFLCSLCVFLFFCVLFTQFFGVCVFYFYFLCLCTSCTIFNNNNNNTHSMSFMVMHFGIPKKPTRTAYRYVIMLALSVMFPEK